MILFELLDVAILDLLHESFASEKVGPKFSRDLAGNDDELVAGNFRKRNRASRWNHMRAPLENETGIPHDQEKTERRGNSESAARGMKQYAESLEQHCKAKNEDGCERDKVPVSEGGRAMPIGITGNQVVISGSANAEI